MRTARVLCLSLFVIMLTGCSGGRDCAAAVKDFMSALHELDSRLDVGLTVAEYGNQVGDLKVAYDRVAWDTLPDECAQRVGIPAEAALNEYVKAHTQWQDCIQTSGCETSFIESNLQGYWTKAHEKVVEADQGLRSG